MKNRQSVNSSKQIVKVVVPVLFFISLLDRDGIAQERPIRHSALTPQLAQQLIATKLRNPYVGNSIYFKAAGTLYQDLSEEFAKYMIKQGLITCGKNPDRQLDFESCQLTSQGRKSPYFGTSRNNNEIIYYIRWADDKNPQILVSKIVNPSSVPFRFTRVKNPFGLGFFHGKFEDIKARAEFAFQNGRWVILGIKGMPGD